MSSNQAPIRRSNRIADPTYRPLTHYSRITSRPTTFHAFPHFPMEIQNIIFIYAAGSLDQGDIRELIFNDNAISGPLRCASARTGYLPLAQDDCLCYPRIGGIRRSFMMACRLARLMALEVWKREIDAFDIRWAANSYRYPTATEAARKERYERRKEMLSWRLQNLIGEVKGWTEGRKKMLALEQ